jgi:outer membrane protein OmpA-like peptidoglycan-associated protein
MSLLEPFHKLLFFSLIIFWVVSCSPKSKNEQPVANADSTKKSIAKKDTPKIKDTVAEKPVEKKESRTSIIPKKKTEIVPAKTEEKKEPVMPPVVEPVKEPVKEAVKEPLKEAVKEPIKETVVVVPPVKEPEKVQPPKIDSSSIKKAKGKPYYFRVVRKDDGKEIFGNLQLQEAAGATQFQVVKSGEVVYLDEPNNRRGAYTIVALLPGYRQSSLVFGYFNPPIATGPNNEEIVTLTLDKARTGDYIDFNNVHFLKNTSIMRPVSQTELDELANLLKENPRYKIRIYGFCNGTQDRESYTMGTSTNFFALDPKTNKKETISSKELSVARAENVKAYLVKQGIDPSRISTKGEGGKVPLYLESGPLGQHNDRIEVEFVKN